MGGIGGGWKTRRFFCKKNEKNFDASQSDQKILILEAQQALSYWLTDSKILNPVLQTSPSGTSPILNIFIIFIWIF